MKRSIIVLFSCALIALTLNSCEGTAVYSPSLQAASKIFRTSASGVQDTITLADTLHVGDTVRMGLLAQGYFHYLTSFTVKVDTSALAVSLAWNPADSASLAPNSDPQNGIVIFNPDMAYIFLTTMRYTPKRAGKFPVEMTVASSAGQSYSPVSYSFDVNVK